MTDEVEAHVRQRYELHKRLGKGAYGIVIKAIDKRSRETVALKKIFDAFRNQTDAQRTFREIMFLQEFGRHPNIIKLLNIIRAENDKDIYLVFEFMEADLHNVIKKLTILKDIHKRYIMCQLFRAVRFLHSGNVLHRDLKPSNVLLDADCRVKLADFGLARSLSQLEDYPEGQNMPELTEYVATRWYRSPEILLAAKRYTKGVDMWSLGCILGEMLLGKALFPGSSTINQIERIMMTISRPSKTDIDGIGSHYAESVLSKIPLRPRRSIESLVATGNPQAIDLMNRLLIFSPHKRLTVEQCLVHPYVMEFHNTHEEPALNYDVTLPLPDHIQLTVDDYRNKLYELITSKKTNIRRIQYDRLGAQPKPQTAQPGYSNNGTNGSNGYGSYYGQASNAPIPRSVSENPRRQSNHHVQAQQHHAYDNQDNYNSNGEGHAQHRQVQQQQQTQSHQHYASRRPETTANEYYHTANGNRVKDYYNARRNSSSVVEAHGGEQRRGSVTSSGEQQRYTMTSKPESPVRNGYAVGANRRKSIEKPMELSRENKNAAMRQSSSSIPSTFSNGTVIHVPSSQSYNFSNNDGYNRKIHNIRDIKRSATAEKIAPIAQAECSDTDFESERSAAVVQQQQQPNPNAIAYNNNNNKKDRAQSVEGRNGGENIGKYVPKNKKETRRSNEKIGIFSALRPSKPSTSSSSNNKHYSFGAVLS